ncbi:MAG: protein kinase domain-containing protein [Anaerovoracaceae bacterium]|jgi:serine/threonine protein kinase
MKKYKIIKSISKKANGSRVDLIYNDDISSYCILAVIPEKELDDSPQLLKSLIGHSSPYIAKIYDVCLEKDKVYIVEEYVKGKTLGTILREKAEINQEQWREWEFQITKGLLCLHTMQPQPLLHGDIHPDNIIIDYVNQAKLIDFSSIKSHNQLFRRRVHAVREFLDPRILKGFPYDNRADFYSLGKVMNLFNEKAKDEVK